MKEKKYEYFNNGIIEMCRQDKFVFMRNLMNESQLHEAVNRAKQELPKLKTEINQKINDVLLELSKTNPYQLLVMMAQQEMISTLFINSESKMQESSIFLGYAIRFLQSIIASNKTLKGLETNQLDEIKANNLIQNICELLKLYHNFYIGLSYMSLLDSETDKDTLFLQMYLQLMDNVSGNRYQCFQKPYFEILLSGQNDLIFKTYNITTKDLIIGLEKFNKFLSFGLQEAMEDFEKSFIKFQEYGYQNPKEFKKEMHKNNNFNKASRVMFGDGMFDFGEITQLPERLLRDLSYGVGEETSFASIPDPFFPDKILPINKKPLLKLDNSYYCFWSRTLFDKFYRVLYKSITKEDSDLKELWNKNQKETTESNILKLICEKLKFDNYFSNNYYYRGSQKIENDAIILYENKIIVVEIKAGALSNSSISEDFQSFENNFNDIFNKGITQGERLINLIAEQDVTIYDEKDNVKTIIPQTEKSNIFVINITVDDMNEVTAQFENTKYATYSKTHNCICISLSDLLVYCDYFDDKITFFHFLSKRCKSISTSKIRLNDELDHLGLYISHNDYTIYANGFSSDIIDWSGYREALDEYFCNKYTHNNIEKPKQELPLYINKIIEYLNTNHIKYLNSIDIASFILDLSTDTKKELDNVIKNLLENNKNQILNLKCDEINMSFVVGAKNYNLDKNYLDNHIYATMRLANEKRRILFNLIFEKNEIIDLIFEEYDIANIKEENLQEIDNLKDIILINRRKKYNGKIGRNELCPCGSGKKYKKCCLK